MRKWTIPLTFVGLGGLSAVLFSKRARDFWRFRAERRQVKGRMMAWNDTAKDELHRIQRAVTELEHSFSTRNVL